MTPDKKETVGFRPWLSPWTIAGLTLLLGVSVSARIALLDAEQRLSDARARAISQLATERARLEGVVNAVYHATSGLVKVIGHQGGIAPDLFQALAARSIEEQPPVRSIAVAPGNVVSMIYPVAGNERVLGLRYQSVPEQNRAVLRAMQSGKPVLDGPLKLVQGGEGFILRAPVFTGQGVPAGSAPRYWGMVSIVADVERTLGALRSVPGLTVALRRVESGAPGGLLAGDRTVFARDPVTMEVLIPGQTWQLAALPSGGWPPLTPFGIPLFYLGLMNSTLLSAFAFGMASRHHLLQQKNRELLQEIGERARAEGELRLSQQKYLNLFQLMPDMVGITRRCDGRLMEVNAGFEAWTGWRAEEALGRTTTELGLWSPERRARALEIVERTGELKNFEIQTTAKSGTCQEALLYLRPIRVMGEDCLYFMAHDVSELKRYQETLEHERSRLGTLLKTIPALVWMKDPDGVYLFCNGRFERFFGASEQQILGRTDYDFVDRELADLFRENDLKAIAADTPSRNEEWITYADDGHRELLETIKTPVHDGSGKLIGVLGIARDITAQRRAEEEREKLEAQLRQAQKMEAVGRLAGGVAHDFNNKLMVIRGFAELAGKAGNDGEKYRHYLDQVIRAAEQSGEITRQLLAFSRQGVISPRVVDLNEVVRRSREGLCRFIGEDIRFETRLAEGLWPVVMDPIQIDQILMNLVVNARDAMPDGGVLTVATGNLELSAEEAPACEAGDYVQLSVTDSGCGMDAEGLQHIFEPFYTTKEAGRGTGLGLATVYGIVTQNRGVVQVQSEAGQGTTFRISFPRSLAKARPQPVGEAGPAPGSRRSATVLLVEDDAPVRTMTATMLEHLGYRPLVAAGPHEALAMLSRERSGIDLLLTDLVMPEMNGRDLSRRIASQLPGIRVLFMSGYTAEIIDRKGVLSEGLHFIQKPFGSDALDAKLQEILQQG